MCRALAKTNAHFNTDTNTNTHKMSYPKMAPPRDEKTKFAAAYRQRSNDRAGSTDGEPTQGVGRR